MAKKVGKVARFKIQRRFGTELPGLGKPGALERRPYPPGENGNKRRKYSDYALRLEEKQKIRLHYGVKEEQLRRFIRDAKKRNQASVEHLQEYWHDWIGFLEHCQNHGGFKIE